jgi:MFS family permease
MVAGLAQKWHVWYFGLIIPVAFAGGIVMTLAWGLLFKLTPPEHRGAVSGLATTTKGVGLLLGAPLAGLAIDLARPYFNATNGYQVLWWLCGLGILGAIPLVATLIKREAEASGTVEPQPG